MANSDIGLTTSWESGSLWDMTRRAQVVTFIGAGGKTTCCRSVTRELESAGQRVITTTTTKVSPEEYMNAWKNSDPPPREQDGACFWYVNVKDSNGKWIGPSVQAVDAAIESASAYASASASMSASTALDVEAIHEWPLHVSTRLSACSSTVPDLHDLYWVIEGDGARGLRLKCWEWYEPQIPRRTKCAVLVLDRDLWGNFLQPKHVHRPERCSDLLGRIWNAENAWRYFLRSPVFDPRYKDLSWVILLNSPRKDAEMSDSQFIQNSEAIDTDPLKELSQAWIEIQEQAVKLNDRPIHLRLAVGDAKEGIIQWYDLW